MPCWHHTNSICVQIVINGSYHTHIVSITNIKKQGHSTSSSRSRSGYGATTNRDGIRCYNYRKYDHFARDCPNSREERDLEQLQQMLNLKAKEQTHLLTCRQDSPTQNSLN